MALSFWADSSKAAIAAWNSVTLGTVTIPGMCVLAVQKGRDVDTQKSKGKDGHTLKDNGAAPGKVTIKVTLVDADQWNRWQQIRPTIDPNRPGGPRQPLAIQHPMCSDRGITAVYVKTISVDSPAARSGMKISIECDEWVAQPKPSKSKTKTLDVKKLRQNSFVSDVPGETDLGQDFVAELQRDRTKKEVAKQDRDDINKARSEESKERMAEKMARLNF